MYSSSQVCLIFKLPSIWYHCNKENCKFHSQNTGYPVRGAKRLQLNMFVKKINQIDVTEKLKTYLFPILWVEEVAASYIFLLLKSLAWTVLFLLNFAFSGDWIEWWYASADQTKARLHFDRSGFHLPFDAFRWPTFERCVLCLVYKTPMGRKQNHSIELIQYNLSLEYRINLKT